MKQFKSLFFVIFLLSLCTFNSNAQKSFKKYRYYSIGGCLNVMNYVGDLDPGPSFLSPGTRYTRYNIGVTGLYRIKPRISLRGTISYGRIKGDDANSSLDNEDKYRAFRNLSFRNQIYEAKFDLVIDLFENSRRYTKRPDYTPYMFIGLAYFHHSPEAKNPQGDWIDLKSLHTEGQGLPGGPKNYSRNQLAIPIGVGFRYKLSKQWDLAFDIGWRFTLTDYLDDVAGVYYDKQKLTDAYGDEARIMSDRSYAAYSSNPELAASADNTFGSNPETYYAGKPQNQQDGWTGVTTYGQPGGQRGDLKGKRDVYTVAGFHLTYIFPGKVVCPKFR
ncbi:DUF6089 family protein [Cytophaga aurantiaca]|uniref:DUF6089 family protein n=1 Tax=Cytophaga aurantiaca TaxID=29530 RepID=UPI0003A6E52E|nr:DUF6089 family protein [Cytophaga aurantiaca]